MLRLMNTFNLRKKNNVPKLLPVDLLFQFFAMFHDIFNTYVCKVSFIKLEII